MRTTPLAAVVAGALLFGVPAAAQADVMTYLDQENVWAATPDASRKLQITTDGDYWLPSVADDATIVAARVSGSTRTINVLEPDGTTTVNVMPMRIAGWPTAGPTGARVKPHSPTQWVYTYLLNHGPNSGGLENRLAVVTPKAPGSPTSPAIDQPGRWAPTWHGDRLVAGSGKALTITTEPLKFEPWLTADVDVYGGEVSRNGDRVVLDLAGSALGLVGWEGSIPGGRVTSSCVIPFEGKDATGTNRWAISPGGERVAWSDGKGLHTALADPGSAVDGRCVLRDDRIVSATGTQPSFSTSFLEEDRPPAEPSPQAPAGSGQPQGTPPPVEGAPNVPAANTPVTSKAKANARKCPRGKKAVTRRVRKRVRGKVKVVRKTVCVKPKRKRSRR